MIVGIYSMYDDKAGVHGPFFVINDAVAEREFYNRTHTDGSPQNTNPEDWHLYKLGTFDDVEGAIYAETPTHLAHAHVLKRIYSEE